jgi:hypothetical protein
VLSTGQAADSCRFAAVLERIKVCGPIGWPRTYPDTVAADKAYSRANRTCLRQRHIKAVIPEKAARWPTARRARAGTTGRGTWRWTPPPAGAFSTVTLSSLRPPRPSVSTGSTLSLSATTRKDWTGTGRRARTLGPSTPAAGTTALSVRLSSYRAADPGSMRPWRAYSSIARRQGLSGAVNDARIQDCTAGSGMTAVVTVSRCTAG